jgi:chemosensory pili system protein ChpA (sensor histidine kinase/response regulator)
MSDSNAVGGLKWVKNEIVASLQRVRIWIEAVVESGSDGADLPDAISALKEVRGVLGALQLPGPMRLVEEMQDLCEALATESLASPPEAAEGLTLALIQLPDYLGRLQAGLPDNPLALLPSINDLRESRGVPPLSEAELLVPTTVLADTQGASPAARWALVRVARKIRPHFHRYLLQWFRGESSKQGLVSLGRLFHQLRNYIQDGIYHELFLAAEELVEGILEGGVPADAPNKALVGRLDRVIKAFTEETQGAPDEEARALLQDLLAHISVSDTSSYQATEVPISDRRQPQDLVVNAHTPAPAPALGPDALAALSAEVRKELMPVKEQLELFAQGPRDSTGPLAQLEPKVSRLATALTVTGAADLVERLRRSAETLGAMGRGTATVDDTQLMTVAADLLGVELAMAELGWGATGDGQAAAEIDAVLAATLSEALVDMGKAKEAIAILADVPEDLRPIRDVPDLLYRVAGALRIVNQAEAADVLAGIVRQLKQGYLAGGHIPVRAELERLAEAVSAVDLYLEGLATGAPHRPDLIGEAQHALDELIEMIPAAEPSAEVRSEELPTERAGVAADQGAAGPSGEPAQAIDPELLEIFLEEADSEQETVREQYAQWRQDPDDAGALTVLRRSFHTLKGSGRLVGALRVGELAAAVETLLNRVIDHSVQVSPVLLGYMDEAVGVVPDLIAAEAEARPFDVGGLIHRATALAAGPVQRSQEPTSRVAAGPAETALAEIIPWPLPAPKPKIVAEKAAEDSEDEVLAGTDGELLDIFRTEARQHLAALREYAAACANDPAAGPPGESVVRSLHTLAGSARMTGIRSIAEAIAPIEQVFRRHMEGREAVDAASLDLLSAGIEAVHARLDRLPQSGAEISTLRDLGAAARALVSRTAQPSASELEEAGTWTIEAGTPEAEGSEPEAPAAAVVEPEVSEPETPAAQVSEVEAFEAEAPEAEAPEPQVSEVEGFAVEAHEAEVSEAEAPEVEVSEPDVIATEALEREIPKVEAPGEEFASAPPPSEAEPEPLDAAFEELPADREMVAIFLEDGRELLDKLDAQLRTLQLAPTEAAPLDALQRLLHTLKGSARLSGLTSIGDLSHAFESLLTAITNGKARVDDDTLELAQRTLDTLSEQMDAVGQGAPVRRATQLIDALGQVREGGLPEPGAAQPAVAVMAPASAAVEATSAAAHDRSSEPAGKKAERVAAPEGAGPLIRVRADLLNRLVNDAGEISIYRSRLAQQNGLLGFRLGELDQTVSRLREKLRHLEIETEAQILHRFQRDTAQEAADHAEFDPLELDRFSTLQQLSRSLAETVNDLISLRTLLSDLQRDSDALLQQQARIADDLQDGLLRTRMVPFAQVVPRLHRLVRQTAAQTGREARLEVFGPEVELDRSIQERVVAPLEHLLRNAVAHGIEAPAERVTAGKPATGVISLMLSREGNDVVITVADDGAGLNVEAIRRRALERGLLSGAVEVSDEEVAQLILTPGFSTAEKVTQIAGRGVGLDVVSSEIKQMSGSFAMETQPGRGTSFTIRLPLTLAIIEALLVAMGEEIFAVPHATVEGVSRVERSELDACYRGKGRDISYGGHSFRVIYLGAMLQLPAVPDLGERRWLPVALVRAGDQRIAFHVDQLIGSERIVVKPLGPQLSSISWLSGGTILADGRVALILDLIALIRSGAVYEYRPPRLAGGAEEHRQACVMVVDDSLTVRRVTTRLLRRHDMDVLTAQDGIEALTLLEERIPDVMLLDIEMPRMDGYELTRHIRRSPRFNQIPIIMITSRTGEKHRNYALELGVDRYLGKPYQEAELMDEISSVLAEGLA